MGWFHFALHFTIPVTFCEKGRQLVNDVINYLARIWKALVNLFNCKLRHWQMDQIIWFGEYRTDTHLMKPNQQGHQPIMSRQKEDNEDHVMYWWMALMIIDNRTECNGEQLDG
jgi:hypothetical protein